MGVPKLWTFVSQVNSGTKRTFTYSPVDPKSDRTKLIFDGPSFAYWFWRENSLKKGTSELKTYTDEYSKYANLISSFIKRLTELNRFNMYFLYDETNLEHSFLTGHYHRGNRMNAQRDIIRLSIITLRKLQGDPNKLRRRLLC